MKVLIGHKTRTETYPRGFRPPGYATMTMSMAECSPLLEVNGLKSLHVWNPLLALHVKYTTVFGYMSVFVPAATLEIHSRVVPDRTLGNTPGQSIVVNWYNATGGTYINVAGNSYTYTALHVGMDAPLPPDRPHEQQPYVKRDTPRKESSTINLKQVQSPLLKEARHHSVRDKYKRDKPRLAYPPPDTAAHGRNVAVPGPNYVDGNHHINIDGICISITSARRLYRGQKNSGCRTRDGK
ncbi:hypothetical protein B0H10DRAFT_2189934 [Mycena sp. CBHHK59/15]|nr:hypothetical protein B0H10DRAFT_2189934 [Mycena sp. CBHHK59/15]